MGREQRTQIEQLTRQVRPVQCTTHCAGGSHAIIRYIDALHSRLSSSPASPTLDAAVVILLSIGLVAAQRLELRAVMFRDNAATTTIRTIAQYPALEQSGTSLTFTEHSADTAKTHIWYRRQ